MAKRPTARARASRAVSATSTTPALANLKSEYLLSQQSNSRLTKKSKRDLKHDALLARVREGSGISKSGRSRGNGISKARRPNKKLKTDLDDMKSALEDVEIGTPSSKAEKGGKMVMKSLQHRPGSMKRKKVLEEREMERFKRNLAELAKAETQQAVAVGGGDGAVGSAGQEHIQQRWKALRQFIVGTMVKDKAFVGT
ncbi:hypothetical protein CERZMDRAFT_53102 [Cercospora zeae-maydis SCOH1-5]|uniref:Ribosome biogenesis protein SLX9 n=1 Tax=Cercospora zeae-maydis SCOH1-5 TaxID=717836 RepID=A0A6A6EYA3_9PEZI|nr:hypothetical protein CERZMDRAFT_53102 [Cercospora zeae-maydis SCOH1-5]